MSIVRYPPLTVETAVDYLQANLSFNDEFQLSTIKKEDLSELYNSLGAYARSILGLWSGNDALMESCRAVSGDNDLDADDASLLIIGLLWERLHVEDT
jgi:hypothetical protein